MDTEMDVAPLEDLVHQAEQLTAEMDAAGEMPRVERNFGQLLEAGNELWSRTALSTSRDTRESSDVRASVLLGTKGYDLRKVTQHLDSLSTVAKKGIPAAEIAARDTTIQSFLARERETVVLEVIESVQKQVFDEYDRQNFELLDKEWQNQKMKILNTLIGSEDLRSVDMTLDSSLSQMPPSLSFAGTTMDPQMRSIFEPSFVDSNIVSSMDATEASFSRQIENYVDDVVSGRIGTNLLERMLNTVIGEQVVVEVWETVEAMVGRDLPLPVSRDCVQLRKDPHFQKCLVQNAVTYLEFKYRQFMESHLYGEAKFSAAGSTGLFTLVKNYLTTKTPNWMGLGLDTSGSTVQLTNFEDGYVEGHPVWCFVWHCLRCGAIDAAIEVAHKASSPVLNVDLVAILRELKSSDDRRLPNKTETQLRLQYQRTIRMSNDPFKKAVYCMLGSCDLNDIHPEVAEKVEDFLWLRLMQVRPNVDVSEAQSPVTARGLQPVSERLTLQKLQYKLCEEYGESHFNAIEKPHIYFKVLFLSGQFEAAIDFLWRSDKFRSHASHIAIVLHELGLLALPPHHLNVPLLSKHSSDPDPWKRLNFARLICLYIQKFKNQHPLQALNYYFLLRNIKDANNESVFFISTSELVRDSQQFDQLLGYMSPDGCRVPGAIDKFHGDIEKIIEKVAQDCENSGRTADAVKLYDLIADYGKVLDLLNPMIGSIVAERKAEGSNREKVENLALFLAERYFSNRSQLPSQASGTFFLLIDLMTFFDYYHDSQNNDALQTIKKLGLIPFKMSEVEQKVNLFNQYNEEIRRNIPDILLATMNIVYNQYKQIKSTSPQVVNRLGIVSDSKGKDEVCAELKETARAIITYVGMIPFRMPGDTNARLVQLEVMIN